MSLIESEQELNKKINDLEELTPQGISEDDYIKGVIDNFNNVYLKNLRKSGGKERFTRDSEQPKFLPQKDRYLPRNFKYANKQESTNKNSDIMDIVQCKKFVNSVDESDVDEYDKKLLLFIFDKQLQQLQQLNDDDDEKYYGMIEAIDILLIHKEERKRREKLLKREKQRKIRKRRVEKLNQKSNHQDFFLPPLYS